jgi:flagellar M-ring protein FliF
MDFVNKAYAQLAELFRSMSVGTRLTAGLLLVVVVVSLAYLFQYQVAGGDEYLLDGRPFTPSELTAIEAAFAQAGLGKSQVAANRIRIPRGQKDVYLAALADNNALPADFYKYLDEATAADSPFASAKSQDIRRANAKQKELALILSRMRGIDSATVHYDEEIKPGLVRQKQKTAMVAIQTSGGELDKQQLKAIKNVVASAYAGLDRDLVTVTDMTSGLSYGGPVGPGGVPEDESIYAEHKQRYESDWRLKITEMLSMIPGVIVGVNVELNPEMEQSTQSVKIDPKPVTVMASEFQKEDTRQQPGLGGRPGAVPNGVSNQPVDLRQVVTSGPESQSTESRSDIQNVPGYDHMTQKKVPLTPKKVTASIEVPASYYTSVWNRRNPPVEGQPPKEPAAADIAKIATETEAKIKETVRNLLPDVAEGTNPYPHIVVSTYTDLPGAPPEPPTTAATAGTWLADNWQTLALIGVGLMSLLMLRSMVRSPAALPATTPVAVAESAAHGRHAANEPAEDEDEPEPAKILRHRFRSGGPDLKAELHEIVKENPDAAATILRAWIGEAA